MRPKSHMKKQAITGLRWGKGRQNPGWPSFKCGRYRDGGWSTNTQAEQPTPKQKCKMAAKNFYSFSALNLALSFLSLSLSFALFSRVCFYGRQDSWDSCVCIRVCLPMCVCVCVMPSSISPSCSCRKVKLSDNFQSKRGRPGFTSISVHQPLIYYFMKMAKWDDKCSPGSHWPGGCDYNDCPGTKNFKFISHFQQAPVCVWAKLCDSLW